MIRKRRGKEDRPIDQGRKEERGDLPPRIIIRGEGNSTKKPPSFFKLFDREFDALQCIIREKISGKYGLGKN